MVGKHNFFYIQHEKPNNTQVIYLFKCIMHYFEQIRNCMIQLLLSIINQEYPIITDVAARTID